MAALLENNAAIITCNHTHHPTGMMLPIDGHDIQSEHLPFKLVTRLTLLQPLKKQLYAQQTVQAKILNQAAVLADRGIEHENMLHWAKSVRSGDPDNYEARAAAYYWKNVFPKKVEFFRGRDGDPPNNLLNYGYAILRAIVARGLVSFGLVAYTGYSSPVINIMPIAWQMILWNHTARMTWMKMVCEILDDGEDFLIFIPNWELKYQGSAIRYCHERRTVLKKTAAR